MRLSRSTTILLNLVLILVIVLLAKAAITSPDKAYAQGSLYSYKVISIKPTPEEMMQTGRPTPEISQVEEKINAQAQDGWKLHSITLAGGGPVAVLERSR